ncbi:unnamed protein product [Fusarium graminearum]|uniref:ABC transporter domain-containing protein n=1 Tax=Gibberella zeae TaxID=5518 RepID=A0A9N8RN81_GIBZA|nr:unnamed protein product [Fusarium graminearum]
MENKRRRRSATNQRGYDETQKSEHSGDEGQDSRESQEQLYKRNGLVKLSLSITTSSGQRLHLVSYYSTQHGQPELQQPANDPAMQNVIYKMDMRLYPELQMDKAGTSLATACAPIQGPPYVAPQPGQQPLADYGRPGCIQAASSAATLPYEPHVPGCPPTTYQQYTSYVGGQGMHLRNYVNAAPYEQSGHLPVLSAKSCAENTFPNTFPNYYQSTLPTTHESFHDQYSNQIDQSATGDARSTSYISHVALQSLADLNHGPTGASSATNATPLSRTMSNTPPGNSSCYGSRRFIIHDALNHTTPPASESGSIQLSSITSSPRASSVCRLERGGFSEDVRALTILSVKVYAHSAMCDMIDGLMKWSGNMIAACLAFGYQVLSERHIDGIGPTCKLYMLIRMVDGAANSFLSAPSTISNAYDLTEQLRRMIATKNSVRFGNTALKLGGGNIEFDNVSFWYPNGKKVFKELKFTIEEGTTVAVVGLSGCGKSTLVDLLTGQISPTEGSVKIDGQDIRNAKRSVGNADMNRSIRLAEHINTLEQRPYMFHVSFEQNIGIGNPNATLAEIREAARKAGIHDHIMTCDKGYSSMVYDNGSQLSGGQRQRLGIARMYVACGSIYIYDESFNSLDRPAIETALSTIEETLSGKTTLLDAIALFEACRSGILFFLDRAPSNDEMRSIQSGSVYIWDERQVSMRPWDDGRSWSNGGSQELFRICHEMEGDEEKRDGLVKRESRVTHLDRDLHLVSYYSRSNNGLSQHQRPIYNPGLQHVLFELDLYGKYDIGMAKTPHTLICPRNCQLCASHLGSLLPYDNNVPVHAEPLTLSDLLTQFTKPYTVRTLRIVNDLPRDRHHIPVALPSLSSDINSCIGNGGQAQDTTYRVSVASSANTHSSISVVLSHHTPTVSASESVRHGSNAVRSSQLYPVNRRNEDKRVIGMLDRRALS